MSDDLVQRLRNAATDWDGSQMVDGEPPRDILNCKDVRAIADEIERLRACLKYEEHRFATQSTHSEGCHSFGPRHYECALQEVERLRAEVARLQHEADAAAERHVTIAETRADIAERELAALRDRIANAPILDTYVEERRYGRELVFLVDAALPNEYKGRRVRLVRED